MPTREEMLAEMSAGVPSRAQMLAEMSAGAAPVAPEPMPQAGAAPQATQDPDTTDYVAEVLRGGKIAASAPAGAQWAVQSLPQSLLDLRGTAKRALGGPSYDLGSPIDQLAMFARVLYGRDESEARPLPKGESAAADALFTAGEWGMPFGKASKLDPAMAAAAAGGEYLGNRMSEGGGEKGELAGLIPLAGSLLKSATRGGWKKLTGAKEHMEGQDQEKVAGWIKEALHSPETSVKKLEKALEEKEVGDIADLTADLGAANVEAAIPKGTEARRRLGEIAESRKEQSGELLKKTLGGTDVAPTQAALQQRALEVQQKARGLVEKAEPKPEDVAASLAREEAAQVGLPEASEMFKQAETATQPVGTMAETSANIAEETSAYRKQLTEEVESPAWKKFEESKEIDATALKKTLKAKLANDHSKLKIAALMKRPEMQALTGAKGPQRPKDMGAIVSDLKKAARDEKTEDAYKRILGDAAAELDKGVEKLGDSEAWTGAKEATKRVRRLIGGDVMSEAKAKSASETLGRQLFKPKEQGAVNARAILEAVNDPDFANPKVLASMEEYILARAADEGLTDKFMNNYGEMLTVWGEKRPDFVAKLDAVVESKKTLETKTETAEAAQKEEGALRKTLKQEAVKRAGAKAKRLTKAVEGSQLAAFTKAPQKTIKAAIESEDPKAIKMLSNAFKSPAQKEGLKTAVGETLAKIARNEGLIKNPEKLAQMQKRLKGIVGEEGLREIAKVEARERATALKKIARGKAPEKVADSLAEDLKVSLGTYAFLNATNPKNALLVGGVIRRTARKLLSNKNAMERNRYVDSIIENFVINPTEFMEALKRAEGRGENVETFTSKFLEKMIGRRPRALLKAHNALKEEED